MLLGLNKPSNGADTVGDVLVQSPLYSPGDNNGL